MNALVARFKRLTQRERLLTLLVAAALVWAVADGLLIRPLQQRMQLAQRLQTDADAAALQAAALLEELRVSRSIDPDVALKQRLSELLIEQARLGKRIEALQNDLIRPEQMVETLQAVLQSSAGLQLKSLTNLPVEAVSLGGPEQTKPSEPPSVVLFRHGLVIEVSGTYLELLAYLKALEQLPWRLYWQALELDSAEYPQSHLKLQLHSYSLDGSWIGV